MKICFISTDFPPTLGGVASHAHELAKAMVQLGHDVYVLTSQVNGSLSFETLDGINVLRPKVLWQKPFYTWGMSRFLKKFLKERSIDLVHVHGMRPLEATKGLDIPVVFTNHTSGFLKRLEKPVIFQGRLKSRLEHVAMVLAPSYELCEATKKTGYAGPVNFVSNGVDTTKFSAKVNDNLNAEKTLILARRLVEKNGVVVFAKALTLAKNKKFKVLIAGVGPEQAIMESIFKKADIVDRVTFLGAIKNSDMPALYKKADFSVLPSFYEATSITGLESMASGLPLIGTSVGGIPYLIEEGITGFLIPPHDAESMSRKIDEVLAFSDEKYIQLSQASVMRAKLYFDWIVIAKKTEKLYLQVL
ncbi:glycosyltransferase family 4 protein [Acinetobacter pragensis]|uniref:glycosyltransferase family 4 protein n=1 Tax=Acinetobacter pragensis TaxID=1806892 RepID=UPI0039EF7A0E